MKESQLLNYAMQRLWHERSWLEYDRANSGRIKYTDKKNRSRMVRGHKAGTPDITGFIAPYGRAFGIELKVGKNGQTDSQKVYEARSKELGGVYFVVRTTDELERVIEELRILGGGTSRAPWISAEEAFRRISKVEAMQPV